MRLETGVVPLFCHHDMHYFRAYCKVKVGNRYSIENENTIGFVVHCFRCGYRAVVRQDELFKRSSRAKEDEWKFRNGCPECEKRALNFGGPLWIGEIQSKEFVAGCARHCKDEKKLLSLFDTTELDIPLYYDLTTLSREMRLRTPRINEVIAKIQAVGHPASRCRLNHQAIRTSASLSEVRLAVKELAL
jgi:tRNA (guanine26-N2/guanine27-N2)-dimethyltransferase